MAIFAISDLHLSFNADKPMDVFGDKWSNYTEKLKENWNKVVGNSDTVIIPGDTSWAMYIDDALEDFKYINSLNGRKIILKGNHDYWWTTLAKMNKFLSDNELDTISFLQNGAENVENVAVCGTRGWTFPPFNSTGEDKKIFEREKQRLVLSLEAAVKLSNNGIIVAMHYPPMEKEKETSDFIDIMAEYKVKECVFGHLHGASHLSAPSGEVKGIKLRFVSCDYTGFTPVLINR